MREKQTSTLYKFDKKVAACTRTKEFLLNLFKEESIFRCKIELQVDKMNSILFKTYELAICINKYVKKISTINGFKILEYLDGIVGLIKDSLFFKKCNKQSLKLLEIKKLEKY